MFCFLVEFFLVCNILWRFSAGFSGFSTGCTISYSFAFNVWLDSCIAVPHAGEWKERLDFFDEESKSSGFTIIGGDPRYNNVTSVIKCVASGKSSTEVTWTCTYEPVGDAPAPEHMKEGVVKVLKTLEKAVKSRQTLTHTETFDASPDAVWKAVHNLDNIVPKYLPDVFESATNISGQYYGKPGGIRIVKFGPGMENCL